MDNICIWQLLVLVEKCGKILNTTDNLLEIIFENDELIAINKPHGLLVHRSRIANDAEVFALQLLRDQIGQRVYPAHRLDRKTSGVLLFSKSPDANARIQQIFRERKIKKTYHAIVRGFVADSGTIDYALTVNDKTQDAVTHFKSIQQFELPIPSGKFPSSRYSLLELKPITGRFHQIRKHLAHIFHPIIGDRPHGCNKQNKLWKTHFNMIKMMLHAARLEFEYPNAEKICIEAKPSLEFQRVLGILNHP